MSTPVAQPRSSLHAAKAFFGRLYVSAFNRASYVAAATLLIGFLFVVVQVLPITGANVDAADKEGRRPLYLASRDGQLGEVERLLAKGADVNALYLARTGVRIGIVAAPPATGASDDEEEIANDWTPLHAASYNGHIGVVEALLSKGADIDAKEWKGWTALHRASIKGHTDVATALLAAGADVEAEDWNGWTPLHWASSRGSTSTVAALLANGADVNAKAKDGGTPLHRASDRHNANCVVSLLANGAKADTKNKEGDTPLKLAKRGHGDKIVKLLENTEPSTLDRGKKQNMDAVV